MLHAPASAAVLLCVAYPPVVNDAMTISIFYALFVVEYSPLCNYYRSLFFLKSVTSDDAVKTRCILSK